MEAFTVRFAKILTFVLCLPVVVTAQGTADNAAQLPPGTRGPFSASSMQSEPVAGNEPLEELEAAKIIARVGDEVILAGDLFGQVNQFLHARIEQLPPEQKMGITPDILNTQRWKLIEQLLPQAIQGKLMYLDFARSIPKERLPEIKDSLYEAFDEKQLPTLIERANVQTAADLDKMLRSFGSSLSQQRMTFAEQLAAAQWKQKNATDTREISHDDLIQFYRDHIEDYRIPARARWEQLTAKNDETGSDAESYRLVGLMGNEVYQGAALSAVAKRSSHGATAESGGSYDWTTKNSLKSKVLDEAVFSLPVGRLSRRLKDTDGYHIVRVVERQDESFVPFSEAQEEIRNKIKAERSETALDKYTKSLRDEFPVWTIFEDDQPTSVARRNP